MNKRQFANRYAGQDPILSTLATRYQNGAYVGNILFPARTVANQSGKHFVYDKGRFRIMDTRRGPGSHSKEVTLKFEVGPPYFCEDHVLKQFVPDEDVDNSPNPAQPFIDATENVTDRLLVAHEKEIADMVTSTTVMTQNTTLSGTDQWSDFTNSDPIDDIQTGMDTIADAIGVDPNVAVMSRDVWSKLKNHPDFLERIKYSQRGVTTQEIFAELIGVERVYISTAWYNSSAEGQADAQTKLWGKDFVLAYVAPNVQSQAVTLGVTYEWRGHNLRVERLRGTDQEDRKGTYVRAGNWYYDTSLVAAGAGYLLKSVVA